VSAFTAPEDRNITSRVMELHQRSGIGNATIVHYLLSWFRMPEGFENTLWLSQIQQGLAMKYAVEHWRRQRPRCMGALYWQLNDCWPAPSWSSIDSAGRWKALHYMARAFFAPLLVSGVEDPGRGVVEVHATSDLLHPAVGTLRWRVTRVDGSLLDQGDRKLQLPPQSSSKVATLALQPFLAQYTARDLLVWLSFEDQDGAVLSRNLVTFARPKHLELREPDLTADLEWLPSDTGASACRVTLTAANPALWAWLELRGIEAAFSDNFLCLEPETPTEIIVRPLRPVRETAFRRALAVRSLRDTYA
jgi:beta-mannosidase